MTFSTKKIGRVAIKNRLVRSATYEASASTSGYVTDKLVAFYEKLARGGAGLIIKGFTFVQPNGRAFPLMTGIHDDSYIAGLAKIAKIIHEHDSKVFLQLSHCGREVGPGGWDGEIIAPSPLPDSVSKKMPRKMTVDDIKETERAFVDGARRAFEADYDGVQLHGAHGYLINQFLSPHSNKRSDEYGRTLENRLRFVLEIIEGIQEEIGKQIPLSIKMNAVDFLSTGIQEIEAVKMAKTLEKAGIDAIEVSGGVWDAAVKFKPFAFPPECRRIRSIEEEGYHVEHARLFRQHVKVPLIVVGGIRRLEMVETVLRENIADFCSFSRPFICEPDFPNKWREGKSNDCECISCNKCGMDVTKAISLQEQYLGVRCLYKEKKSRRKK
ncbi:MAG: NADH:flavin oxidoreductase [Candidatus Helarchaeota archaeon]